MRKKGISFQPGNAGFFFIYLASLDGYYQTLHKCLLVNSNVPKANLYLLCSYWVYQSFGGYLMAQYVLKYKPTEPSIKLMLGCAASQIVEEQGELIKTAFSEIEIVVEVDDAWGICKITHVNGLEVAH